MKTGKLWLALPLCLFAAGCGGGPTTIGKPPPAATDGQTPEIRANLARLEPEDRRQAEAQKFCAVQNTNPLGSMGPPVKVMVKDQPVFLCCKSCVKKAQADPDKTLAKVEELKAKKKAEAAKK